MFGISRSALITCVDGEEAQVSQVGSQQRRARGTCHGLRPGRHAHEAGQAWQKDRERHVGAGSRIWRKAESTARSGSHRHARAMVQDFQRSRPAPCLAQIAEMLMTGLGRVSVRAISLGKENVRISGE